MIQKELADRICAEPNCKDYSRISIMAQTFCDVSYECSISRNIFNPKPKVNSSIIRLKKKNIDIDLDKFSYMEHPSNIAVALEVCSIAGIKRTIALRGMQKVHPDEGALIVYLSEGSFRYLPVSKHYAFETKDLEQCLL